MNKERLDLVKEIGFSLLEEGKTIRIRADGYSMFPAVKPGYIIYIEPFTGEATPVPGEIIAWKRDTGFVVHRLIRIEKDANKISFITRGDSCKNEDEPVIKDQVAGKVIRTEDMSGKRDRSGSALVSKPDYLYNRLLVWFIIRFNKLRNIMKTI
jgi:signal peptidase I